MKSRRESLKIIGAVGATCAFPFAADELYGQHVHPEAAPPQPTRALTSFTADQVKVIERVADLIIPGAVAAGVPGYIEEVVTANKQHRPKIEAGVEWLNNQKFLDQDESTQIAILTPLCEAADKNQMKTPGEIFFGLMKSMTADGYYTSRAGLVEELGYKGNTVLSAFPECTHKEHQT